MANRPSLGLFQSNSPRRGIFDTQDLANSMAAPQQAREAGKVQVAQALARLPEQILAGINAGKQAARQAKLDEAELKLKESQTAKNTSVANKVPVPKTRTVLREKEGQLTSFMISDDGTVTEGKPLGFTGPTGMKIRNTFDTFGKADGIMKQIRNLSFAAIKAENPEDLPGQIASLRWGDFSRSSPEAVLLQNTIDNFTSNLANATGQKGVLTELDVQKVKNGLPNEKDTVATALAKLKVFDDLFEQTKFSSLQAYSQPIGKLLEGVQGQPSNSAPQSTGKKSLADVKAKFQIK